MSAEILRRAAALMRERAEAATQGPWRHVDHGGIEAGEYDEVIAPGPVSCMAYCYGGTSTIDGDRIDLDGEHIASWHPAVAVAVADLLDHVAARAEKNVELGGRPFAVWSNARDAIAVARAYLGEPA